MNHQSFLVALQVVIGLVKEKITSSVVLADFLQRKRHGLHHCSHYSVVEWLCHEGEAGLEQIHKQLPYMLREAESYQEQLSHPL